MYRLRSRFVVGVYFTYSLARWERNGGKMSTWVGSAAFFSLELWNEHKFQAIWNVVVVGAPAAHVRAIFTSDCLLESKQASLRNQLLSRDSFEVKFNCWNDVIFASRCERGCGWAIPPYGCVILLFNSEYSIYRNKKFLFVDIVSNNQSKGRIICRRKRLAVH